MSELTIAHLTEAVQIEGTKSEKRDNKQIGELATLNKSFAQYFKSMAAEKLDKLEERREAVSGKAPTGQEMGSALRGAKDAMGLGLIGFLAAVGAALSSLAIGLTAGFGTYLAAIGKMFDILTGERISKGITVASKAIRTGLYRMVGLTPDGKLGPNLTKLMGMKNNAILRIRTAMSGISRTVYAMVGLGVDGKPVVGTSNFMKRMFAIGKAFRGGLNNIANMFRPLTTLIGGNTKEIGGIFSRVGDGIKSFLNSFKVIGKTFQSLKGALSPIFTVFKTMGRVIFAPLTLIMSIVDAIKGAIAGFQEEGVLGGILGAAGGLFGGLIGMPLDLLKSAISWIAGKLGFENFSEMLDSFSFQDGIMDLFMGIASVFNGAIDWVKNAIGGVAGKIASFFGFGDEEEPEVKEIKKGKVVPKRPRMTSIEEDLSPELKGMDAQERIDFYDREQKALQQKLKIRQEQLGAMTAEQRASDERDVFGVSDSIKRTQQKIAELEEERRFNNVPPMVVNAPTSTTTNNSSNTALVGDGAPATDGLDRVA